MALLSEDPVSYIGNFMDKVAAELRERLKILCKMDLVGDRVSPELKPLAQNWTAATQASSPLASGPIEAFKAATIIDVQNAVDYAVRNLPVSAKKPELTEGQIFGAVVKQLQAQRLEVPKSLATDLPGMLASHPELNKGIRDKSYIPIRGT